jgi:pimeloyl-ACP methyl ester carboxylesterase
MSFMNDSRSPSRESPSQKSAASPASLWKWGAGAIALGAAAGGAAVINHRRAREARRRNPPLGSFITVDDVALHYVDRGQGPTIVLLHGNGSMIEDWVVAGILDELAKTHRVIAFDRPGFGHSERPRSRIWTPAAQAGLLAAALHQLDVETATVVGHSFGAMVATALALDHSSLVSGIVLIAGYYYPSVRGDVLLTAQPAIPLVGDVMRYTVSPLLGAAMTPHTNAKLFDPAPVAPEWTEEFPIEMTLRPSQIRAAGAEAGMMIPAAASLAPRYDELTLPVTIVAGSGDRIVDTGDQSGRLHQALPQSRLVEIPGAGHMAHHTASQMVVGAISDCASQGRPAAA